MVAWSEERKLAACWVTWVEERKLAACWVTWVEERKLAACLVTWVVDKLEQSWVLWAGGKQAGELGA